MAADRKPERSRDDLIEWFTVSYRTIYVIAFCILAVAGGVAYYYYVKHAPVTPPTDLPVLTTARFAALEGSVQVKRAGTLVWVNADANMTLTKLDLVRTGSGATAEI